MRRVMYAGRDIKLKAIMHCRLLAYQVRHLHEFHKWDYMSA